MHDLIKKIAVEENRFCSCYGKPPNVIIIGYKEEPKFINAVNIFNGIEITTIEGYIVMGMTVTVSKSIPYGISVCLMEEVK